MKPFKQESERRKIEKEVEKRVMTMDRKKRNLLFEKTVRSKTVLSFGYLSFYKL